MSDTILKYQENWVLSIVYCFNKWRIKIEDVKASRYVLKCGNQKSETFIGTMQIFLCIYIVVCSFVHSWTTLCKPWTVTYQTSPSVEFCKQEILEWVAISYSTGSSQTRDQTASPALGGLQVDSLPLHHLGSPIYIVTNIKYLKSIFKVLIYYSFIKYLPWIGKIPWRRQWLTTPLFWPVGFGHDWETFTYKVIPVLLILC